ncbi:MAG: UvrD-helicase domain-containing protein, partial [Bacteroidetes bacterium]|nr:UvrD-helicase domain-containing protein [Bacteroidota bacterium]
MSKLKIYRASAGSGKTYRLTYEYLRLLFRNPFSYRNILAVTFTNKATGEMKKRILKELSSLANGETTNMADAIAEEFKLTPAEVQVKAREILNKLLHNYSRFSISTIDSFFQEVIRAFARETGLHAGYNIELDNEKVLSEAADRLLSDVRDNEPLRKWLMRFAEEKIRDGKSWNLKYDIQKSGYEIFREEYRSFDAAIAKKLADKTYLDKYMTDLQKVINNFENSMQQFGIEGLKIMKKYGLTPEDFSYGKTGIAGYFVKLGEKSSFEPLKRVLDGIGHPDKWYTKSSPDTAAIVAAFEEGLDDLLVKAVEYYNGHVRDYNTACSIISHLFILGILADLSEEIREYANEKNIFLLSDAVILLRDIIADNDAPFIYEKTGAVYKHFMIDEFQDTSRLQWKNFSPLVGQSLSEDNTSLVVGDVKQSIYRWRNSDWNLLATEVENEFRQTGTESHNLPYNRRSLK